MCGCMPQLLQMHTSQSLFSLDFSLNSGKDKLFHFSSSWSFLSWVVCKVRVWLIEETGICPSLRGHSQRRACFDEPRVAAVWTVAMRWWRDGQTQEEQEQIGRGLSQRGSNDRHLPVIKMPLLAVLRKYQTQCPEMWLNMWRTHQHRFFVWDSFIKHQVIPEICSMLQMQVIFYSILGNGNRFDWKLSHWKWHQVAGVALVSWWCILECPLASGCFLSRLLLASLSLLAATLSIFEISIKISFQLCHDRWRRAVSDDSCRHVTSLDFSGAKLTCLGGP